MRRFVLQFNLACTACVALFSSAAAQEPAAQQQAEALRVFLDCQTFWCDFDHFRREIPFVNWMRDRQDAQVHILGTAQRTGGGGREHTLAFIGLEEFGGRTDTLVYVSSADDTEAEIRDGLVRTVMLGLVPYVAGTPIAERLAITYQAPAVAVPAGPVDDPWDYWVFRVRGGGNVSGESQRRRYSVNGSLSANRTTEGFKISIWANGRYSRSELEIPELDTTIIDSRRNYSIRGLSVWSLGPRWSAGVHGSLTASTFVNQDLVIRAGPAIEHNIFPYSVSTRRLLTLLYTIGVAAFKYEEETIFDKTSEVRPIHNLELSLEVQQPWGEIDASLEGSQFLHDLSKHRIDLFGGFQVRLFRGLNFNAFGNVARVKDQLFLSKAGLTPEDILLSRRAQGTDFQYWVNFGFSYRFGSKFNNIVNPRMEN
ncbi:MAG: hypothetical protein GTN62_04925 [Gemmatimonadales bacterium]|nr:hypothetical protein [Gemmatimonadales bacterium]NIN10798.1 hypothetical protein [Gemmatimonadales bacterium]NIN49442.1 hypothetical protein [Gemmatimonadales bacterium]NIP06906.1 hypothetical protein [Gemmatimonadales bacterium]NIR02842.1 hypothetical protein [Gemmatimonadales bacterium]